MLLNEIERLQNCFCSVRESKRVEECTSERETARERERGTAQMILCFTGSVFKMSAQTTTARHVAFEMDEDALYDLHPGVLI